MAKGDWWFKFEYRIWRTDPKLRRCSLATKGLWLEILCIMHDDGAYELKGTALELARLIGCDSSELMACVVELQRTATADIAITDDGISIISRRLQRAQKTTEDARKRQAKFRENGGGDPERWTAIRAIILTRDGKICAYCGRRATTVDHVEPKSKGGSHNETNLVAACKSCNFKKGTRTLAEAGMSFFPTFNQAVLRSNSEVTPIASSKQQDRVISNKSEVKNNKEKNIIAEREDAPANAPPKKAKKPSDPRKDHPAIKAVLEVMSRYPLKDLWDRIIREIGEKPNIVFMTACYETWRSVNGSPMNLERWLFEPHKTGMIPEVFGGKPNGNFNGRNGKRTDADVVRESEEFIKKKFNLS